MTEETSPRERTRIRNLPRHIEGYFLGLLRRGERWNDVEGPEAADLATRQVAFIREQIELGRYLLAGPVAGEGPLAGMMIIAAKTPGEALALASEDPGVKAGRLLVEVHPVFLPSLQAFKVEF